MTLKQAVFVLAVLQVPSLCAAEETRRDLYGDSLPPGARMRLGTVRFRHDGNPILAVAYSPDGKLLATCGGDDRIRLWDARTGRERRRMTEHIKLPHSLAFSPDSKLLASGGEGGPVHLWDVDTGKCLHTITIKEDVFSLVFSRDGKWLAVGSSDKRIHLWDTVTGKRLRTLEGHKQGKLHLSLSPNGKWLASGGWRDGMICLWDVAAGKLVRACGQGKLDVEDVHFAPDGKMLASCGREHSIHLWDTATGKEIRQWQASQGWVRSLAFTPDGHTLLSGDTEGNLCAWDTATGERRRVLARLTNMVWGLSLSPDGKTVASVGWGSVVRRWDVDSGRELTSPLGHEAAIDTLCFVDEDRRLLSTAADGTARRWNVADGKQLLCEKEPELDDKNTRYIALSSDGLTLAAATGKTVRLRNPATRKIQSSWQTGETVQCLRISPDGNILAAGSVSGIHLWDVKTGKIRCRLAGDWPMVFSADSRFLAAADKYQIRIGKGIHLWNATNGAEIRYIPSPNKLTELSPSSISDDGRMVAGFQYLFGAKRNERRAWVVVWEAATGKERLCLPIEWGEILTAAFSPDGRLLATAGTEQTVRLWDVRTGKERASFRGHECDVHALAFSKNGRLLASGGTDTTILLWPISAAARTRTDPDKELSTDKLRELWTDLAGADAARAFKAMIALSANPSAATALLRQHMRAAKAIEGKTGERLLAHLDDDDFSLREQATKELEKLGNSAEPLLRQALRGKPALELRRRAELLLEKLARETPERLRQSRALELLEWLDTPESRRLLEELAAGAADAWLTREAKAALTRHASR